jgi:NAD(P)-dependent dehydrogenase (short-subunit alcohol dehydrogenase family)
VSLTGKVALITGGGTGIDAVVAEIGGMAAAGDASSADDVRHAVGAAAEVCGWCIDDHRCTRPSLWMLGAVHPHVVPVVRVHVDF